MQTFGKYQILGRIAMGGTAEIVRARLEGIGGFQRTFAIKRLSSSQSDDPAKVDRLVVEAKIAGLLSHANLVQILDLGEVEHQWYIAMEYVHGRDLGAVLSRCGERGLVLPIPHAVFVVRELLKGLEYAHGRQVMRAGRALPLGIVHRDVSPRHVLLSFQGEVKLTGFGSADTRLELGEQPGREVVFDEDYASPEQLDDPSEVDLRADLFSVGVVLFEMLTGRHPFRGPSAASLSRGRRVGEVEWPNDGVPGPLRVIVERALQREVHARHPSATAFREALDKFFHDSGFLFTQATLGAYLHNLFSTSDASGDSGVADPDQELVTEEVPLLVSEDEDPTRLIDATDFQDYLDASERGEGDDETLVRRSPLVSSGDWTENLDTLGLPNEHPSVATEHESVGGGAADTHGGGRLLGDDSTWIRPRVVPEAASIKTSPGKVDTHRGWLFGILLFVLGSVGGASLGWMGARRWTPGPVEGSTIPRDEALLRIRAPSEVEVRVNGLRVVDEVSVLPEVPTPVRIRLDGYEPWDRTLTLHSGELRVLFVTPIELREAPVDRRNP